MGDVGAARSEPKAPARALASPGGSGGSARCRRRGRLAGRPRRAGMDSPMIPGLPLLLILWLIWSLSQEGQARRVAKQQGRPYTRANAPVVSPGFGRMIWFIAAWFFLSAPILFAADRAVQGDWRFLPLAVPCLAVLMPWTFAKVVLLPLHQARLALLLLRVPSVAWGNDRRGGPFLAATRALLSARAPSEAAVKRITTGLEKVKPLRAGGVAASGLLAAFRGDLDLARLLLASVEGFHVSARPDAAVRMAREWLAVDAAERGEWQSCAKYWGQLQQSRSGAWSFQKASGPRSRLTKLIGCVGSRIAREPRAPGSWTVWISWALAPRRRVTLPWVRRALAEASAGERAPRAAGMPPASRGDALDHALSAHAIVVGRGAGVHPAELHRAMKSWDQAFEDPGLMARVQKRSLSLEVPHPERVLFEMRRGVLEDLAIACDRARMPLRLLPADGLGVEIVDRLRNNLLESVERATESLHLRMEANRRLPASDELAESLSVQEACSRAAVMGGEEVRRIAFTISQGDLCNHAVWLYNDRGEKPVANVIMHWLHSEASAVGDAEGAELHRKNLACGI